MSTAVAEMKTPEREPTTVARDNWYRFNEADTSGHRDFVKRAKRNNNFYAGEQWDKADKARLDREGRPALTLNMILSTVNAMIGEQLDRKVEAVFRAGEGGTEEVAFALNKITRAILSKTMFDDVEEMVFADGLITGRGFFDIRMDFTKNMQGEVSISSDDPIDIIIDAQAKEMDPSTWSEVFVSRWMTPSEIGEEYGWDKAAQLEAVASMGRQQSNDNFDYFDQTYGKESTYRGSDGERGKLRRIRVIERQHFEVTEQYCFVDLRTGAIRPLPFGADVDEAKTQAKEYGVGLHKRKGRRVRITTSADDVLLYDDWSIYRSFTVIPFFPYFRRGNPFGPVDNLIDPQNLLNKTSSQELHIVNTTANSGWIIQEDSLVDMDAEDLEERGAETGLVLQYKRGYEKPDKITSNSIPTGIDRISQKAAAMVREISAVNSSMLGTSRADQSGRAQEAATARGQVQVSVVLNNLKRCRVLAVRKILELIQDFYTETRYFTVVGDMISSPDQNEQVAINELNRDGSILNDVSVGEYDIEMGFRPAGGSLSDKEFEEALRLRELNVAIPDHVIVQYSNLTKRQELAEFLKQSQGFGEPSEEQQALEQMQMEHQIRMLEKQLADIDAKIEVQLATAAEKMAKARTMDDFNLATSELNKLKHDREMKQLDISQRIALSARSHQNQNAMNAQRITSQVAMKSMDMAYRHSGSKTEKDITPKKKEK